MTNEELNAIRERAEAATPGPWFSSEGVYVVSNPEGIGPEWDADYIAETETKRDAEFIAHARQDVPKLLAEVIRLKILAGMLNERLKSDGETIVWEFSTQINEDLSKNTARYEKIKNEINGVASDD